MDFGRLGVSMRLLSLSGKKGSKKRPRFCSILGVVFGVIFGVVLGSEMTPFCVAILGSL